MRCILVSFILLNKYLKKIYLDLEGTVYDYFNGIDDLKHRRIRFVGNPVERIREDYLRILRYFR